MIDRAKLRQLAQAATPGEWVAGEHYDEYGSWSYNVKAAGARTIIDEGVMSTRDAAFIAAANPSAVLELLDALDRAVAALKEYEWQHETAGGGYDPECSMCRNNARINAALASLGGDRCICNDPPEDPWKQGCPAHRKGDL